MNDSCFDLSRQKALELGKAFIKSIMENKEEKIPNSNGMSVLRNVIDLETRMSRDIVLRSITIPFWKKCLELVRTPGKRYRVAAIGTPGIGKTTATPILIRMLLNEGYTVVYLFRSVKETRWYYEFTPRLDNSIVTKIYPETMNPYNIPSLQEESTYYIVDPGKAVGTCDPDVDFQPKVILVPSPDSSHWGGPEFTKTRVNVDGFFKYMPLWSLEELVSAQPVLCPAMTEEEVRMNYRCFGGVPRHVFGTEAARSKALKIQEKALKVLSNEQTTRIANNEMDAVDSFSEKEPKSSLMGYILEDDDKGEFSCEKAVLLSPQIEEKVYSKHMAWLWGTMISQGKDGWKMFEAYTRSLMTNELNLQCRRCVGLGGNRESFPHTLGGCTKIRLVCNPIAEVISCEQAMILFHSVNRNNLLFDFVYRDSKKHFHAFQATVGSTHPANPKQIKNLQDDVGGASKLSIYYLVPSDNFEDFVTVPVNPNEYDEHVTCDIWHVFIPDPRAESRDILQRSTDTAVSSSETTIHVVTRSPATKASPKCAAKASPKRATRASSKHAAELSSKKAKSSKHPK